MHDFRGKHEDTPPILAETDSGDSNKYTAATGAPVNGWHASKDRVGHRLWNRQAGHSDGRHDITLQIAGDVLIVFREPRQPWEVLPPVVRAQGGEGHRRPNCETIVVRVGHVAVGPLLGRRHRAHVGHRGAAG